MFKKICAAIVFLICSIVIFIPQVSAQDVYVATGNYNGKITDYYIMTETFRELESKQTGDIIIAIGIHSVGKNYKENAYSYYLYTMVGSETCVAIEDENRINENSGSSAFVPLKSFDDNTRNVLLNILLKLGDLFY